MPKEDSEKKVKNYPGHTPTRSNRGDKGNSKTKRSGLRQSSKVRGSEKRKNEILKVIFSWIKRNEDRMNIAQRSVFSNLINEEIMESSTGLYEKISRAVQTYNDKLKKELINHVNLKLKIACIERGVFTENEFSKNLVISNQFWVIYIGI